MGFTVEPFIHVAEVWVPHGEELRRHSGAYGPHTAFAEASASLTFARGSGLPGQAWARREPVLFRQLDERFVRHAEARTAGLDAGVAFPLFRGDDVIAVVSLLCGSREHTGGCIEVWQPNDLRELALSDGYYGRLESFEDISKLVRFQRGRGLPGIAWASGLPHVMDDLGNSSSFIRAAAARSAGVHAGVAIPLYRASEITSLLVLLSAQDTPLARAFEVWTVTAGGSLELVQSYYRAGESTTARGGQGAPGYALAQQVFETRMPVACQPLLGASGGAFRQGLGLPIYDGSTLRAIVNLLG
jgi:hypothetical protein